MQDEVLVQNGQNVFYQPSAFSLPPLCILIPSDVFPPGSVGGAAWSTHALARALIERGHTVTAVVPQRGRGGIVAEDALGVPTIRWGYRAPGLPFVQNYVRYERLWPRLADWIVRAVETGQLPRPDLIHAQHVQTCAPAVIAAHRLGVPVAVTVRDHWPWDYFTLGLHGDRQPYPRQNWASLVTELPAHGRLGPLRGTLALPAVPYMLAHVRHRRAYLARADAIVAPSHYIARKLEDIAAPERIHVIHHLVDMAALDRIVASPPTHLPESPYLLYVGKLERNKGAGLLIDVFRAYRALSDQAHVPALPRLLICGNGPLRGEIERELAALDVPMTLLDWIDHDEALRLTAHCELLLFPSLWGEPLSRVLLEASAVGAPILAMPTGGTPDIIVDGVSGALAGLPEHFARRLAALLADPSERQHLGAGARRRAEERFAKAIVVRQMEELYTGLVKSRRTEN